MVAAAREGRNRQVARPTDEQILERLVALNHERAEEEKRGLVRWLWPDFQNPSGKGPAPVAVQKELDLGEAGAGEGEAEAGDAAAAARAVKKRAWPKTVLAQVQAIREVLAALSGPSTLESIAFCFTRAPRKDVLDVLDTLTMLGQAKSAGDGKWVG
jgi:hypothetical protein